MAEKKEKGLDISEILEEDNVAEMLSETELTSIGEEALKGYKADRQSRAPYEELLSKWTKLALQISEEKTFPWQGASNVKYPLLATAAMQFAARAYPSLVPSNGEIVKVRVLGKDPTGQKKERASRIGKFMSYQVLDEMEEWEEEMDRLLITLPIAGTVFKKTYFDPDKGRNVSCTVMPKDLVVNYWAKDLESAERCTQIYKYTKLKIQEKIRSGFYVNADLGDPQIVVEDQSADPNEMVAPSEVDSTTPFTILEQHGYLDLDKDGLAEPYVITFEETSGKVLRIAPRFSESDVFLNAEQEIAKITAQQYYTKYSFVPNPDGGFYDIGFGRLLGSINAAADTMINQITDAGTLSNMQSGFIAKGLRVKMGESGFRPGEWKEVNATGQDLKNSLFALPLREPSAVLMNLLQFLITSGKELASVAEIFVGKMPGQNTPATTTMASIEQGMKVFTAVYKRIFRSMTKEFRKLYRLNKVYLNPQTEVEFLDAPMEQSDFQGPDNDVIPAADPASVSAQEKQVKVQHAMQLLQLGTINPMELTKRYLEAFEIPQIEELLMQPQPKVDPEVEKMKQEAAIQKEAHQQKMQSEQQKAQLKATETSQKLQVEDQISQTKIKNAAIMGDLKARNELIGSTIKRGQENQSHRQKMAMQAEKHQQALKQVKEKKATQPKR